MHSYNKQNESVKYQALSYLSHFIRNYYHSWKNLTFNNIIKIMRWEICRHTVPLSLCLEAIHACHLNLSNTLRFTGCQL